MIHLTNNSFIKKEDIIGKNFTKWMITNDGNICKRIWYDKNIKFELEIIFPEKMLEKYNRTFKLEKEMIDFILDLKLTKIITETFYRIKDKK